MTTTTTTGDSVKAPVADAGRGASALRAQRRRKFGITLLGWGVALIIFFPIFWMIVTGFKTEAEAIAESGLLLQIDCPDLAMTRVSQFSHLSEDEFVKIVELHVEVINYALQGIPADRMRLHLCWGNTEGPHHYDIPFKSIVEIVLKASPMGLSFEGANPRHAHEWKVWQDVKLPDGKVIIPGVLDTTTNFIERGVFQVSLFYPGFKGPGLAEARAELIRSAFYKGRTLSSGGLQTSIANVPEIGQGMEDLDRWMVPVSIRYRAEITTS